MTRAWISVAFRSSVAAVLLSASSSASAKEFGPWGPVQNIESLSGSSQAINTDANDGCPILSPMDNSLFIATNRFGVQGSGNDIYVAPAQGDAWGDPVSIGAPVNGPTNDFCPTPVRGNKLFFVSNRGNTGANGDIYLAKLGPKGERIVEKLGPNINTAFPEWSPSYYVDEDGNEVLYFSRQDGTGAHNIYYSVNWGPARLAPGGVNSDKSDARPNVRPDGLEIVWDSDRWPAQGTDVFTARRARTSDPWGTAERVEVAAHPAGESRASLSWDGTILLFGSTRLSNQPGVSDIFISRREKRTGKP